jgi:tetratricopeptide (TPR) repeat protein
VGDTENSMPENIMVHKLPIALFSLFLSLIRATPVLPQVTSYFYNDAKADAVIRHGLPLSYNLEYAEAGKDWDELIQLYPDHPAGYVYKAALIWWQAVEDRQNKNLKDQFDSLTKTAVEKGMAWIQKNPRDKLALAYVASAYGNATRFDATVTRSYYSALRNGQKGHKYVLMAHDIDNNFYDTYIGLGSYNYFTGALPAVIKPFAWLLGARGNKEEGIRQLVLASEKGEYARTEAKVVLLSVFFSEKRWDDYQRMLQTLMKEYPQNHVFYMWASNYFIMSRRWDNGIAVFKEVEKLIPSDHNESAAGALAWLNYNLGRNYFAKQDYAIALDFLTRAEQTDSKNPVLLAQLYLLEGNALDMSGRRDEAVAAYQKALKYPDIEDSRSKSRRYLKSAYGH